MRILDVNAPKNVGPIVIMLKQAEQNSKAGKSSVISFLYSYLGGTRFEIDMTSSGFCDPEFSMLGAINKRLGKGVAKLI